MRLKTLVSKAILGILFINPSPALAAEPGPPSSKSPPEKSENQNPTPNTEPNKNETPIEILAQNRPSSRGADTGRSSTQVSRRDLEERLPRSAPDALRYEPGVYVQQSAHGQGSPYIRGRTGQQTIVLFDGIRMNTSTWRQGPNQYFFTIDSQSLLRIEVTRGGASTLFGSDAIAGSINAQPMEPKTLLGQGFSIRPRASLRLASADGEIANRLQLDTQFSEGVRLLLGAGARRSGPLEGGGEVRSPLTGALPQVPALESDGRTQLGTGYQELNADGRFVLRISPTLRISAAAYAYRQYNSPRTDQCPPPFAPRNECLEYDEQFRSLTYIALDGDFGPIARAGRIALSYQRQHEKRTNNRPSSFIKNGGRDDVDTLGLLLKAQSASISLGSPASMHLLWGGDFYTDFVSSAAWTEFTDIDAVLPLSRGQYLEGSRYTQGGVFGAVEASLFQKLILRSGLRSGAMLAISPSDPASGTASVHRAFPALAGHVGAQYKILPQLYALAHYDRSFRAPNLDDMSSRQQSGPGFQFENPMLEPENADTFELGLKLEHPSIEADLWLYRSILEGAMTRSFRSIEQCPPQTPQCTTSWSRFQLINTKGSSTIDGAELWARVFMPHGLSFRATLAYAFGEGPNPQPPPQDKSLPYQERVPLSRIPPLNGTLEARWDAWTFAYIGAALRWATLQDRLAPTDRSDARIPDGGTPGYAVLDLRAGLRLQRQLIVSLISENLFDAAYRVHGSSINGPGRGILFAIEAGR